MEIPQKPDIDIRPKINPLIAALPLHLKEPKNFYAIQKRIVDSIQTTCSHSEIGEMAQCKKCTEKMLKRRALMKELGFVNAGQYLAWRKIMEEIIQRYPLVDWNKK